MDDTGAVLGRRAPQDGDDARPAWRNFALAGLVAALMIPFLFVPPFRLIETRLFDVLSTLAPPRPPQPGVTVVAIDEPSFAETGQRRPWPRDLHAHLIANLRKAGAKVIALDIIFAEPSTPEADDALAHAV